MNSKLSIIHLAYTMGLTFEHMYFEYMTAWPYLKEGGILVSDDIFWNAAFHKFCREQHRSYWYVRNCGFGATRK